MTLTSIENLDTMTISNKENKAVIETKVEKSTEKTDDFVEPLLKVNYINKLTFSKIFRIILSVGPFGSVVTPFSLL